ncbi:MAG TPA: hypothetical protein VNN08_08820 [Thermoanaerobaculia bacterium]|nr:hypothetical protein [Thermoanaerobaculia bacterium]
MANNNTPVEVKGNEVQQSNAELLKALESRPDILTPEVAEALRSTQAQRYRAVLTYDGGDFLFDANVEIFAPGSDRPLARFTATCLPSFGRGKHTTHGYCDLNYPVHTIKGWRFTCFVDSNPNRIIIIYTGLHLEHIGVCVFRPIPAVSEVPAAGAGYIS